MSFREELAAYTQPDGLISPDKNPTPDSTGNGITYTSLAFILLMRRGEAKASDVGDFVSRIFPCFVESGLLDRSPTKCDEQTGPDDYIFLALASNLFNTSERYQILKYGQKSRWIFFRYIYNNLAPGLFTGQAWFGRQPQVPAHFMFCCGLMPGFLRSIAWCVALLVSIFKIKDSTSAMLGWAMLEAMSGMTFLGTFTGVLWDLAFRRAWPGGMKAVLEAHLGTEHPVAKYWV